jgi:hypothetical protein
VLTGFVWRQQLKKKELQSSSKIGILALDCKYIPRPKKKTAVMTKMFLRRKMFICFPRLDAASYSK